METGIALITVALVILTGPEHQKIEVNPKQIVSIRNPRGAVVDGVRCLIHTTDGKYISVIETCDVVRNKLEGK